MNHGHLFGGGRFFPPCRVKFGTVDAQDDGAEPRHAKETVMEKCPVCGMEVNPKAAPAKTQYEGRTYYFCSQECKEEFEKNPQRFAGQTIR